MSRRDRLRELIDWGREAYDLAASPPANDPGRKVDPTAIQSRPYLLTLGIDLKWLLNNYLASLPETEAETLIDWFQDSSQFAEYSFSEYHQQALKINIDKLIHILTRNGYK